MHITTPNIVALIVASFPASIMASNCNKEQHQNACPDYSRGPACFGTMSWGHCDRGCAESVHVADGTWCSGTGVILALGVPMSAPGSQNPAPPPVPYNAPAAPNPNTANPTPIPPPNSLAASNIITLLGIPISPSPPPPPTPNSLAASNILGLLNSPLSSSPPPPPPPPEMTSEKAPDPPETPNPTTEPPKTTTSASKPNEETTSGCHKTKPDPKVKQTGPYALCL